MMTFPSQHAPLLIIDGFNVLHAGVLVGRDRAGWWKEAAQRRLVERVEQFSDSAYGEIWIVFDRRTDKPEEAVDVASTDARIQVHYAPSADEWIVAQVRTLSQQRAVTVVTSDRPLRDRVRHAGGGLCSPLQFLAACKPEE
jgi:predicted RNA-binding protein with PIN domain